jgi:hypothetical protein
MCELKQGIKERCRGGWGKFSNENGKNILKKAGELKSTSCQSINYNTLQIFGIE